MPSATSSDANPSVPSAALPVPSESFDVPGDTRSLNQVTIGENADAKQVAAGVNIIQIYVEADVAYDVRGLPNPYLGLSAFSYAERAKFAGREKLVAATVANMTTSAAPPAVLFIMGASGSGKSSFAQAGLLPALETHYRALTVKYAIFRPGRDPLAELADVLWRQLGLPLLDANIITPESYGKLISKNTPPSQINVIIIDQFEEVFTQSPPSLRDALFNGVGHLAPFSVTRTHVIATMRADYLPELFGHPILYEYAKQGVDLHAMGVDELRRAIQQPLRAAYPTGTNKFQPELVERLAQDAAENAAYLPLLQVTLEEIWRKGSLTLGAYTNFTDGIKERADKVLQFYDYDMPAPCQLRSTEEQVALLDLLVDLVAVSLDDDARRDVRRQRSKEELAHGSFERMQLIDELVRARLLSAEGDTRDESRVNVDLIHESLLANWEVLHGAITERRHELHQRARFEQSLANWRDQARSPKYLLDGVRLEEARELEKREDIALKNEDARTFLHASVSHAEAETLRELERERQRAEAEQHARHEAERRAESEKQRARILRFAAIGLFAMLVVAVLASVLAFRATDEANGAKIIAQADANARGTAQAQAVEQSRISESRRIAAQSGLLRVQNLDVSLLLSIEAVKLDQNFDTRNNLISAVQQTQQITAFHGHTGRVGSVAFNPDGTMLVSGSGDNTIRLWDVSSGQQIGDPLQWQRHYATSVAFSPDGKILASGGWDQTIRFWDVSTGKQIISPLYGHTSSVMSVAFSPNSKMLASGSCGKWDANGFCAQAEIRLWDVSTGKQIGEPLTGHTGDVLSVAFSPDGRTLASGGGDNTIRLWDISDGKEIGEPLIGHSSFVNSVAFSPDAKMLASASFDRTVRLWNVSDRKQIGDPLTGHGADVKSVAFRPDGGMVASGSWDNTIRLWDVSSGKQIGEPLIGHTDAVDSVAFSPDGGILVSGSDDKTIRLWDISNGKEIGEPLAGHTDAVNSMAFSPDGSILALGSGDKTIRLWDVSSGKQIGEPLIGHTDAVDSVAFSPDGGILASGSGDKTIRLWEVSTGKQIGEPLIGHSYFVNNVIFSPNGEQVASSGSWDKTIRLWEVSTGKQIGNPLIGHSDFVTSIVFNSDGTMLASGSDDSTIRLWDASNGKQIGNSFTSHTGTVKSLAFSPDGKMLASGGGDKTIRLWDVSNGKQIGNPLTGHTGVVWSLAFSLNGTTLASGGGDKTIRLWDISARKQIGDPLTRQLDAVTSVAFSPDGKILASGAGGKMIHLWDVDLDLRVQQERACRIVNRNLTRAEWVDYLNQDASAYDAVYAQNPTCRNLPLHLFPTPPATP